MNEREKVGEYRQDLQKLTLVVKEVDLWFYFLMRGWDGVEWATVRSVFKGCFMVFLSGTNLLLTKFFSFLPPVSIVRSESHMNSLAEDGFCRLMFITGVTPVQR